MSSRATGRAGWLAAIGMIVTMALVGAYLLTAGGSPTIRPVLGLRLGVDPVHARRSFTPGAEGSFRTVAEGEDLALEWTPTRAPDADDVQRASLEFHLGLLVAVRLRLSASAPAAEGPPIELSEASLVTREPGPDDSVLLTWLARTCPTHAEEARRRIAASGISAPGP